VDPRPLVTAVVAPGALADLRTAREVLQRAAAARGAGAELLAPADGEGLRAAVARAAAAGEFLLLPADPADLDATDLPLDGARVLRVDPDHRPRDASAAVRRHLRGRGLDGLRFAVDAWWFRTASPASTHPYGADRDQRADLRLPGGEPPPGGFPVAVLVHGGYWRSHWEADLMEAAAADLTARGVATWNVEYRRPAEHGWDATTADVAAALAALPGTGAPLDLRRVVLLGHSAGGQLAVRLAADVAADPAAPVRPALTVSLAGVLDLLTADRRRLGAGAVRAALGGAPEELPRVYAASSPLARLPVGAPLAVVCGRQDDVDLLDLSRAFAAAAQRAGDDVVLVEGEGDHFSVVDPASAIWPSVVELVARV
ncbi:alpha/beta hydrolase family protein, partial [Kineococcus indalonis]|uniref:alpha/beta hydrolase family protein n=1 Tax=Kineococcus indalonis TaxID=2696566 RepID=UPI00196A79DF